LKLVPGVRWTRCSAPARSILSRCPAPPRDVLAGLEKRCTAHGVAHLDLSRRTRHSRRRRGGGSWTVGLAGRHIRPAAAPDRIAPPGVWVAVPIPTPYEGGGEYRSQTVLFCNFTTPMAADVVRVSAAVAYEVAHREVLFDADSEVARSPTLSHDGSRRISRRCPRVRAWRRSASSWRATLRRVATLLPSAARCARRCARSPRASRAAWPGARRVPWHVRLPLSLHRRRPWRARSDGGDCFACGRCCTTAHPPCVSLKPNDDRMGPLLLANPRFSISAPARLALLKTTRRKLCGGGGGGEGVRLAGCLGAGATTVAPLRPSPRGLPMSSRARRHACEARRLVLLVPDLGLRRCGRRPRRGLALTRRPLSPPRPLALPSRRPTAFAAAPY